MGNQSISIIGAIVNWCGSFAGILTILIVAITANRMLLTAIREKHQKDSTFYRNAKTISFMVYAIFTINVFAAVFGNLKGGAVDIGTKILSMPWAVVMLLVIMYILSLIAADEYGHHYIVWIDTAVIIFGVQMITQDELQKITGATIITAIITIIASSFCSTDINNNAERGLYDKTTEQDSTNVGTSHKGIILTTLWIASVVAAYLAGEYSLIPKLTEYLQERARKMANKAKQAKRTKAAKAGEEECSTDIPVETE